MDPRVGSRVRTLFGGALGVVWTVSPIVRWIRPPAASTWGYLSSTALPPLALLALGTALYGWARAPLTGTRFNRRIALSVALYLVAHSVLGFGGYLLGVPIQTLYTLFIFTWGLAETLLAVWAAPFFALPAATCGASFLVAAIDPGLLYPLMALCNLVLTVVTVTVWTPPQDVETILERRRELRRRARRWLRSNVSGGS